MAESVTTRLALPRWTAGTDTLNRGELDSAMANLEARAARYGAGTLTARPAAAADNAGTYYTVTDPAGGGRVGALFYSTGTTWVEAGGSPPSFARHFLVGGS